MRFDSPLRRGYVLLAAANQAGTSRCCLLLRKTCALVLMALLLTSPYLVVVWLEQRAEAHLTLAGRGSTHLLIEPARSGRNVFFVETSCALTGPLLGRARDSPVFTLNNRQACAVESAARAYPQHAVYVLHTCPGTSLQAWSDASRHAVDYPNVRLVELDPLGFLRGTPLERWASSGQLETSLYPVVHASDVFRVLALWKYGGLYLDLDVITFRDMGGLENFMAMERNDSLNTAVMHMSPRGLGHELASDLLERMGSDFRGDAWSYNGPELVTKTLLARCNVSQPLEMRKEKCSGFTVLGIPAFYPLPYEQWEWVFEEARAQDVWRAVDGSYGLHMWNSISHSRQGPVGTGTALSQLVQRYCPRVFNYSARVL
ncbi:lactosylceramide 4-alpha-galactosyltransferase-like [Bacillus rossius redtenbacheri]|uniref:lactosylceramide 4-alpha-galactosyltransferase-like n=1 Tax=Bacillus rossius redtenbacheri TaxID=93214 RepID=UPI002FDD904D